MNLFNDWLCKSNWYDCQIWVTDWKLNYSKSKTVSDIPKPDIQNLGTGDSTSDKENNRQENISGISNYFAYLNF